SCRSPQPAAAASRALSGTADFLAKLQNGGNERGRPPKPPHLVPRQPTTVLGWTMRKLREVAGWTETQTAEAFGCSVSPISRAACSLRSGAGATPGAARGEGGGSGGKGR